MISNFPSEVPDHTLKRTTVMSDCFSHKRDKWIGRGGKRGDEGKEGTKTNQ
jgi:hypothetical protein